MKALSYATPSRLAKRDGSGFEEEGEDFNFISISPPLPLPLPPLPPPLPPPRAAFLKLCAAVGVGVDVTPSTERERDGELRKQAYVLVMQLEGDSSLIGVEKRWGSTLQWYTWAAATLARYQPGAELLLRPHPRACGALRRRAAKAAREGSPNVRLLSPGDNKAPPGAVFVTMSSNLAGGPLYKLKSVDPWLESHQGIQVQP